jgi:hypothetical protein
MLGSFADWDMIGTEVKGLHKNAEAAGFDVEVVDKQCPCCGFRPVVKMKEHREKRRGRPKQQQSEQ